MAAVAVAAPVNAHGLFHPAHQRPVVVYPHDQVVMPKTTPAPIKPPVDPYYGQEELSRLCSRFIRHVFSCPPDAATSLQPGAKPTESTTALSRFIAYAFHRTRLHQSVAYHALFLLARLKARYPAASCAYGHRLFLTSYMISSKVICDDTYSNKSWAIVGQGFYDLADVNLMEREMIQYLSFDLSISGRDLQTFTETVRGKYRRTTPKGPYTFVPDTSRENDNFGKGSIEVPALVEGVQKVQLDRLEIPNDDPPAYTSSYVHRSPPISPDDSLSSSQGSSPNSPCIQTPPDDISSLTDPTMKKMINHQFPPSVGNATGPTMW